MHRFQLSKHAVERRSQLKGMFHEITEVTTLETGSYEEVTSKLDTSPGILVIRKQGQWESVKLEDRRKDVKGFRQEFGRYYDDPGEAYTFEKSEDNVRMNVSETLQGQSFYTPGQAVSADDVLDFFESLIEERLTTSEKYAASIPLSLFPDDTGPDLNLKTFPTGLRHLREKGRRVDGLTQGYTYLGSANTFFPAHTEDGQLGSANFAHFRGGKLWTGPLEQYNREFSEVLNKYNRMRYENHCYARPMLCPTLYRHKGTFVNPIFLMMRGIRMWWHLQLEKELLLTKPGQPHQGVNLCSNVHEAWNFTTPLWSRISHQTTYCACTTMKNPPRLAYWMTDPSGVVQAKILTADTPSEVYSLQKSGEIVLEQVNTGSEPSCLLPPKRARKRKICFESESPSAKRPKKCTELIVRSILDDQVTLQWSRPDNVSDDDNVVYTTQWRSVGSSYAPWKDNRRSTSIDTAITVHGLTLGVKYQFRVTASLNGISGPSSDPTEPVQVHEPIEIPNNVRGLRVNGHFIEWEPVADHLNEPDDRKTGYLVFIKFHGDTLWRKARWGAVMQPKFNFSHLQYAFDLKVIAENKWSRSQDSEIISVEPEEQKDGDASTEEHETVRLSEIKQTAAAGSNESEEVAGRDPLVIEPITVPNLSFAADSQLPLIDRDCSQSSVNPIDKPLQFVVKEEKHVDHSSDDDVALLMHYQCDEEGENTSEIGQPSAQYNPQALADQEANRPTGRGSEARTQPEIDVSPPHLSPKTPMLSSDEVDVKDLPYLMPILEEQPPEEEKDVDDSSDDDDDDDALLMHYQCDEEGENTSEIGQPSAQYNPQALADQEANRPTGRGSEARAQPEIDVSPPHLSPKSPMLSSDEVDVEDLPYLMPILEEQPLKADQEPKKYRPKPPRTKRKFVPHGSKKAIKQREKTRIRMRTRKTAREVKENLKKEIEETLKKQKRSKDDDQESN